MALPHEGSLGFQQKILVYTSATLCALASKLYSAFSRNCASLAVRKGAASSMAWFGRDCLDVLLRDRVQDGILVPVAHAGSLHCFHKSLRILRGHKQVSELAANTLSMLHQQFIPGIVVRDGRCQTRYSVNLLRQAVHVRPASVVAGTSISTRKAVANFSVATADFKNMR